MPDPPGPAGLSSLTDGPEVQVAKLFMPYLAADPVLGAIFNYRATENVNFLETFQNFEAAVSVQPTKFGGFPAKRDTGDLVFSCVHFFPTDAEELDTAYNVTNIWGVFRKRVVNIYYLPMTDPLRAHISNVRYEWSGLTFPRGKGTRLANFQAKLSMDIDPTTNDFSEG